jgi:hypothetical protein
MIIDKIIIDYDDYNSIYIIIIVNAKEVHTNDAIFNYNRSIANVFIALMD